MEQPLVPVVPGYHLGDLIGRGSSASVWGARRVADGLPVAVKLVLGPGGVDDPALRELATLRGLRGEHLVRLLDAVPVREPSEGLALVMERLDGGSLRRLVAARGRLTDGEIVTVVSPLAAALGGLHRAGIVHGDVSPGNVLFDELGRPALCDLGVSRVAGETRAEVWVTEGFVAPEVVAGSLPGPAADVYAAGALAWFAATGEPPGPSYLRPPSATALAGMGAPLVAVIEHCLSGDPADRPGAVEASVAFFDAAPAEPLRLPGGAEDVESLTRRIRAAAQGADSSSPLDAGPAGPRDGARPPLWIRARVRLTRGRVRPPAPSAARDARSRPPVGPQRPGQGQQPARPGQGQRPARPGPGQQPARPGPGQQPARPGPGQQRARPGLGQRQNRPGPRQPPGTLSSARVARHGRPRERRRGGFGWGASGWRTAIVLAVLASLTGLVAMTLGWQPQPVASATPRAGSPLPPATAARSPGTSVASPGTSVASRGTSSAASPGTGTAGGGGVGGAHAVLRRRAAPVEEPAAVAQALSDARAALWAPGSSADLARLDAPGSVAWRSDAAALEQAVSAGWGYEGVRLTVRSAAVTSHSAQSATLRVVLDNAAYVVVGPQGRQRRPARPGQVVGLTLAWTADGWRVSEVGAG